MVWALLAWVISWPKFQKLLGTGMSNIDFLTTCVIKLLSNAKVTFSQEVATDLWKQVFGSWTTFRWILVIRKTVMSFPLGNQHYHSLINSKYVHPSIIFKAATKMFMWSYKRLFVWFHIALSLNLLVHYQICQILLRNYTKLKAYSFH